MMFSWMQLSDRSVIAVKCASRKVNVHAGHQRIHVCAAQVHSHVNFLMTFKASSKCSVEVNG